MSEAHRLEGLPDPIILPGGGPPPAVKQLCIIKVSRQRQAHEDHPGVESALKGFIHVQILLGTSIDEPQIEHALGRQPLGEQRWPDLRILHTIAKGHVITYHHQVGLWGPRRWVAKAMAVGMVDGLHIWPSEDARLERVLQDTDGGMAAANIARCSTEFLLEIRRQHADRAQPQDTFTTRHG